MRQSEESVKTNPHILVATPGRLLKLVEEKKVSLKNVEFFVLDECDRLIAEPIVRADVQNIFIRTPYNKQTMMFSATMSDTVKDTARKFMRNKIECIIDNDSNLTLHGLQQYTVELKEAEKNRKVYTIIKDLPFNQLVIFMKSVNRAVELERVLQSHGIKCVSLHGGLNQKQRLERYTSFKENTSTILIATDIFARGMDIGKVNMVINYDIPEESDQ
mmetsp:Transcript_111390/g.239941  ORF Transcript_111390/g.239941 Transcript_111390/m.239941 type:complete len:217 (+) Transcript_111390:217-867(+)